MISRFIDGIDKHTNEKKTNKQTNKQTNEKKKKEPIWAAETFPLDYIVLAYVTLY